MRLVARGRALTRAFGLRVEVTLSLAVELPWIHDAAGLAIRFATSAAAGRDVDVALPVAADLELGRAGGLKLEWGTVGRAIDAGGFDLAGRVGFDVDVVARGQAGVSWACRSEGEQSS